MDIVLLLVYSIIHLWKIGMSDNHVPSLEFHITTSEKELGQHSGK